MLTWSSAHCSQKLCGKAEHDRDTSVGIEHVYKYPKKCKPTTCKLRPTSISNVNICNTHKAQYFCHHRLSYITFLCSFFKTSPHFNLISPKQKNNSAMRKEKEDEKSHKMRHSACENPMLQIWSDVYKLSSVIFFFVLSYLLAGSSTIKPDTSYPLAPFTPATLSALGCPSDVTRGRPCSATCGNTRQGW
jgi:hypothetical protein